MKIKLSANEHTLILGGGFLPPDLLALFKGAAKSGGKIERFVVNLDAEQGHDLREALIDHLQDVGFGSDDEPTPEGLILEDLIDKFQTNEQG